MASATPIDVTAWPVDSPEPRGKREKAWLVSATGARWLWKRPSVNPNGARRAEPAIEFAMLRLAQAAMLPAPDAHLATRTVDGVVVQGIIVRSFLAPYQQLHQGIDLLRGASPDYDPEAYEQHTLERVRHVLDSYPEADVLRAAFVRMVVFDAWIGNSDRHQENWGVVVGSGGGAQLAPVYDPAACLGVELTDGHALLDSGRRTTDLVDRYITRCGTGFGDGKKLVDQHALVAEVLTWPDSPTVARPAVATFEYLCEHIVDVIFAEIAPEWLAPPRRDLALHLLERRLAWLKREVTP